MPFIRYIANIFSHSETCFKFSYFFVCLLSGYSSNQNINSMRIGLLSIWGPMVYLAFREIPGI